MKKKKKSAISFSNLDQDSRSSPSHHQHLSHTLIQNMRKKRPPEQMSVVQAVPKAPEKVREKPSGGPNRASGKRETEWCGKGGAAGQVDAEHGSGDRSQLSRSGPGPGKVVLLRRDSPVPTTTTSSSNITHSSTSTSASTKKKSSPKKKVEWIPYTAAPSSPVLSPVWIYKQRGVLTQQREPSPPTLDNLSLNEPLLPLGMEGTGAGEGSCVLGLGAPRWAKSRTDGEGWGQEPWVSGCPLPDGHGHGEEAEAEARPESPGGDGCCYYSSAPASSGGMLPFRRKRNPNLQPSVSWADDDYWASWDGWNEVIDWEDDGPSKRRGRNRNREGKRNSGRGNKGF